ncbi:MAG: hypothetical protein AB8I08_02970 [Sandaracinaceae bacterium]
MSPQGLTFDGRDTLFEAGGFGGQLPLPPRGTLGPSVGGLDAYFAQVDADENFTLFAQGLSGEDREDVVAVQADPFGALVVVGTFGRDGITLPSGTTYAGDERNNVFLIRISSF